MKSFIFCAVLALVACTGTRQVYNLADDPPTYAKAILLHHNALGETVLALRSDPLVSDALKSKLRDAYRKTVCSQIELSTTSPTENCADGPAYRLEAAARAYTALQNAQTEAELQTAVDALTAVLVDLINLTQGAK